MSNAEPAEVEAHQQHPHLSNKLESTSNRSPVKPRLRISASWLKLVAGSAALIVIVASATVIAIAGPHTQVAPIQPLNRTIPPLTQIASSSATPNSHQNHISLLTITNGAVQPLANLVFDKKSQSTRQADRVKDQIYAVSDQQVIRYDLATKQQQTEYRISDPSYPIAGFSADQTQIYPDLYFNDPTNADSIFNRKNDFLDLFNPQTHASHKIGPFQPTLYGNVDHLFTTSKGDDVIGSFGGDDCAGFGFIDIVINNKSTKLLDTGGGCNFGPQYIGSLADSNQVILMSLVEENWDYPPSDFKLDKLYAKNVYTGQETTLYDFSQQTQRLSNFYYDAAQNQLDLVFSNGEIWFMPLTHAPTPEKYQPNFNIAEDQNQGWEAISNHSVYYLLSNDPTYMPKMVLKMVDLDTSIAHEYPFDKAQFGGQNSTVGLLGFWQGQPIIYILN